MIPKFTSLRSVFLALLSLGFLNYIITLLWLSCILSHHYLIFVLTLDSPALLFLVGLNMSCSGLCYSYILQQELSVLVTVNPALKISSIFSSLGSSLQYLMLLFCSVVAFPNFYSYLSRIISRSC